MLALRSKCTVAISGFASGIRRRAILLAASAVAVLTTNCVTPMQAAAASLPSGSKTIHLIANDGTSLEIGRVELTPDGDAAARISVRLDGKDFSDEFLSMRPFRCLSRPKQMWCHLAYPYPIADRITVDDLSDLEYRLMFLWRPYDKVGVDAWNGLYFKLEVTPSGGFSGRLHEADFNVLAVPPEADVTRPLRHQDLMEAQPGQHGFDRIEIY